jgi:hypothetical protein
MTASLSSAGDKLGNAQLSSGTPAYRAEWLDKRSVWIGHFGESDAERGYRFLCVVYPANGGESLSHPAASANAGLTACESEQPRSACLLGGPANDVFLECPLHIHTDHSILQNVTSGSASSFLAETSQRDDVLDMQRPYSPKIR